MDFNVDIEKMFDLKKVKFDFSKTLNEFAKNVVKDHRRRLQFGQGVDMKPMKKLTPLTIADKRAKNYKNPRVPLFATGTMSNIRIDKKASPSSQEAILKPAKRRQEIGAYHQSDSKRPPKREWFGVTVKQEKKGVQMMIEKIDKVLKNA